MLVALHSKLAASAGWCREMKCWYSAEFLYRHVPAAVNTTAGKAVTQDDLHTRATPPTCAKLDGSRPSRVRNTISTARFFDETDSQSLRSLMRVEFSRDSSWTNVRTGASAVLSEK
jgi:hypothetical protein